jgi:hypothetical protein
VSAMRSGSDIVGEVVFLGVLVLAVACMCKYLGIADWVVGG